MSRQDALGGTLLRPQSRPYVSYGRSLRPRIALAQAALPTKRRRETSSKREEGFGLIELVIAMAVLNVGILAIFATFNAGALSMRRASRISTGETLAEKQLELYHTMTYANIGLWSTSVTASATTSDTVHTGDSAWNGGTQTTVASCTSATPGCSPIQSSVTGADGRSYRIDTYVVDLAAATTGARAGARAQKQVTVVVRKADEDQRTLARLVTNFDQSTG